MRNGSTSLDACGCAGCLSLEAKQPKAVTWRGWTTVTVLAVVGLLCLLLGAGGCAFVRALIGETGEVLRDPKTGEIIKTVAPLFGPLGTVAVMVLGALGVGGGAVVVHKRRKRRKALAAQPKPA